MKKVNNTLTKVEHTIFGTARLIQGHTALSRAQSADVTTDQMRAIFTDLEGISDNEINGFIALGDKLVEGKVKISPKAFVDTEKDLLPG